MISKILANVNFTKLIDEKEVLLFDLKNKNGFHCQITNFGARIVSLIVPNKFNKLVDVVLGLESIEDYQKDDKYFGAITGRYANRIANGKFAIDGKEYSLKINNGPNSLHGGQDGFDKVVWFAKPFINEIDEEAIELSYLSKDGEEGFPGNLKVKVIYTLTNSNELTISYWAKTDAKTVINLTNHTYFNLKGAGEGSIESHDLVLNADFFTPTDSTMIPTGEIISVKNTPMDFNSIHKIGTRIKDDYLALTQANGYDHNWILNKEKSDLSWAATASDDVSGIELKVYTTAPGVQFYTGNFLDGLCKAKESQQYHFRSGFCLETQHFANSPNQENFPSTILDVDDTYTQSTIFKFGLKN
ncbi:aldose epimerase family protein [Flavobacterium sp.]|uniref:aldose epimerase family protein n=1 Tax=Flavobacterium sp. TaxID=239 RepID=UPI0038FBFE16